MAKSKLSETGKGPQASSSGATLVTFLLDRTGSMASCKDATIEAFNAYLGSLQEDKGDGLDCEFTFLQFDSVSLDKLCVAEPVKSVAPLTHDSYQPRAATPLIDSCVKTIKALEDSLTKRDDKPKVVVCFQTDGHENASTEYGWDELNRLIKEKSALGWQFNFMGAGIDAYDQARKMGVSETSTVSYDHKVALHTKRAFLAAADNVRAYASGHTANTDFSAAQRMSSGDRFAPPALGGSAPKPTPDLTKPKAPATSRSQVRRKSIVDDFKL